MAVAITYDTTMLARFVWSVCAPIVLLPLGCGSMPGAGVCLAPHPEGIPVASDVVACVPKEEVMGSIELVYTSWPDLMLNDCLAGAAEIDVPCTATTIVSDDDSAAITLRCTDDLANDHALTLQISTPALFFPVCEGDRLRLRYRRQEIGCPVGGFNEAMVVREADTQRLLAATFYGGPESWFEPLEIDVQLDAGCEKVVYECTSVERAAVKISDGAASPVLVYDGTRRVVELSSRYVVDASYAHVEEWDSCGENGEMPQVELVLAEP